MTPEEKALKDAWLAEMWGYCREVPRRERDLDRARAEVAAESKSIAHKRAS